MKMFKSDQIQTFIHNYDGSTVSTVPVASAMVSSTGIEINQPALKVNKSLTTHDSIQFDTPYIKPLINYELQALFRSGGFVNLVRVSESLTTIAAVYILLGLYIICGNKLQTNKDTRRVRIGGSEGENEPTHFSRRSALTS